MLGLDFLMIMRAICTILFFLICVPSAYSHEGTGGADMADNRVSTNHVQGFAGGALNAYEEIMRVIRDGFKQIREGKKEITLYLDLDDNPKTKEKIVISLKNFYQLEDLIKKQVDQSVKEIQKNLTDSPAPPKDSGNSP